MRRILCVVLALILVASLVTVPAFASDSSDFESGGGFGSSVVRPAGKFEVRDTSWETTPVKYAVTRLYDFITFVVTGAANAIDKMTDNTRENFQESVIDNLEFFKDIVDTVMYHDYVSTLDSTTVTHNGVPTYNGGFEFGTMTVEELQDFWGRVDIYSLANSSDVGEFMFLMKYSCYFHGFLGLRIENAPASDYPVLARAMTTAARNVDVDDYLPADFSSVSFPLGVFVPYENFQREFEATVSYSSDNYRVFLNQSDAYNHWYLTDEPCYFLTPDSYFVVPSSASSYLCINDCGYVSPTGEVSYNTKCGIYITSSPTYDTYQSWACPRYYYSPSSDTSETRPSTLMHAVNNYNEYCSFIDNSSEVNYYLVPSGVVPDSDNVVSPVVYDEETFVFTEPVTGAQYQSIGWSYDYTTRTYDIALDAGTYTIDGTDVTQIVSTYGDEKVTIVYYDAAGTALATDEYDYVMISQSACSINGHTFTVETTKEPTCTAPGERVSTCSVCGHQTVEDLPKLEHSFANYTVQQEPTCTNKGIASNTCLTCGSEVTELLDPLGHDWLPTSITDESWVMPDDVHCPDCHGTSFTHTRSDYEVITDGKNLFHIVDGFTSGVKSGVSVDFDSSTMEYTLNGTVTFVGNFFLGVVDPEWFVGEAYTVTVFKTGGSVDLASTSGSTFAFSFFTKNSDNFVRGDTYLTGIPDKYSFTCSAIAPSGGDGFNFLLQCWSVGTVFTDFKFKVQIEKGFVATEYEPYVSKEVEIIPPIYNFTCQDCSTEWTAEAVYQHAYTTFTCSRCDETMIQSEDPDTGLFASIGNLLADAVTWVTDKLSELVDSLSGLNDLFQDYMDQIKDSGGEYPAFLAAFVAILPDDLMTVLWFSLIAALVLVVWKKWFS